MTEPGKLAPDRSERRSKKSVYLPANNRVIVPKKRGRASNEKTLSTSSSPDNNNTVDGAAEATTTQEIAPLTWLEATSDPRLSSAAHTLALNCINDRVAFYWLWWDFAREYVQATRPETRTPDPVEYTWKHAAESLYKQLQRRALAKYAPLEQHNDNNDENDDDD
jgi:hypothetical protein